MAVSEKSAEDSVVLIETKVNKKKPIPLFVASGALLLAIIIGAFLLLGGNNGAISKTNVVSTPTIQKIVSVNELSTFTAIYNGVTQVMNPSKPEKTDYYVSYDAKVNAGIDIKKIEITLDEDRKIIHIQLPDVYITDINVNASSLDFIFMNDDLNTNTVVAQAYKLCEEDVREESALQGEIKNLARQNAVNIMTALTKPFIEQLDDDYTLVIE